MNKTAFPATVSLTPFGNTITIVITKLGTSSLTFKALSLENGDGHFKLIGKDIAWLHKSYVGLVEEKIRELVILSGGRVV